ncbi:AHH domain-containing protein [Tenacibaculum sp. TC6]|uniref:AHH domain-containing protein n=1 Tax=Tenacibaculum sp. TC6 TaxID=3423223 RepID=UPI003D36D8F4
MGGLDGKARFKLDELPKQKHHFATNKHSVYTQKMDKIASKFNLSLDGEWNQKLLPHLGRHPNTYHEFVLEGMQRAASQASSSQSKFIQLFNQYVIDPVIKNPELLRKSGWQ